MRATRSAVSTRRQSGGRWWGSRAPVLHPVLDVVKPGGGHTQRDAHRNSTHGTGSASGVSVSCSRSGLLPLSRTPTITRGIAPRTSHHITGPDWGAHSRLSSGFVIRSLPALPAAVRRFESATSDNTHFFVRHAQPCSAHCRTTRGAQKQPDIIGSSVKIKGLKKPFYEGIALFSHCRNLKGST
jgi:hypothetical protein